MKDTLKNIDSEQQATNANDSTVIVETAQSSNRADTSYIPQITGVRAVAAYMVYLHHFPIGAQYLPDALYRLTLEFHAGVGLFFVLSGYLIYRRYFEAFRMKGDWWGNYTKNRLARIYPMYFLLTSATLFNRVLRHGDAGFDVWFLNLSFLRGFSEEYYMSAISQGWTLTVEECFYFSAPLMFWWMQRKAQNNTVKNNAAYSEFVRFWLPMYVLFALGSVLLGIGTALGSTLNPHGFFQGAGFMFSYTYFGRCFEFFCGMWLARFMMKQTSRTARTTPPFANNKTIQQYAVFTMLSIVGIVAVLWLMSTLQGGVYRYGIQHPLGKLLNNFALPPFYAMLFYGLITERSPVRSLLASRPMVLLGKSSYIYYLIHMGIVQALIARVACPATFAPVTLGQHAAQFALLNVASIALFLLVEDPLNHFIRKHWRLGKRKNTPPTLPV